MALYGRSAVNSPALAGFVQFEPNRGQVLGRTQFVGAPDPYGREAKMRQERLSFVGPTVLTLGVGEEATSGYWNYIVGKVEKGWRGGVPHFRW